MLEKTLKDDPKKYEELFWKKNLEKEFSDF